NSTERSDGRICVNCVPETRPSSQNITERKASRLSLKNTRKLETDENAADITTPVRINRNGVNPPWAIDTPNTSIVAASAPVNAPNDNAQIPSDAKTPNMITSVAPTPAPAEIPNRYGSANGLRTRVCIAAPANAKPAPTIAAINTRGARKSHTIVSYTGSEPSSPDSRPVRTPHTPEPRNGSEPNANDTTALAHIDAPNTTTNGNTGTRPRCLVCLVSLASATLCMWACY